MLAHVGLPVGEWAARASHDPICLRCPMRVTETLRPCLWICPQAHFVWRGFDTDPVFLLTSLGYKRGTLDMLSEDAHVADAPFKDLRFVTISSITLWVIWKVRCSHILSAQPSSVTDTLREI